jgi:hypothetical protein
MTEPVYSTPDKQNDWDDTLDHSLEVANFLDALERIVTRVFGAADHSIDNDNHSTDLLTEED